MNGKWKVDTREYQKRVNYVVNVLDGMGSMLGVRPAERGRNIWAHSFREWNERADALTHIARNGGSYDSWVYLDTWEILVYSPVLLRGGFDGGVDRRGTGCGCWLEVGLKSKYHEELFVTYREVFSSAWTLGPGATVTDAELSAAERLVEILPQVIQSLWCD